MIRRSILTLLSSLVVAGCADMQTAAPIDERDGAAKPGAVTPVTEATPAVPAATPPAAPAAPAVTTPVTPAGAEAKASSTAPLEQALVETRPLPASAPPPAAPTAIAPMAKPTGADLSTPGAHKDPASPLAQRVIYFDFDSAVIDGRFQPLLEAHATYLKANPGFKVILQGHTDERGSREYNLALGQRRAESVRQAMALLGVPDGQMEAVSLGEEKPAVEGHDEAAWKMNRRTEIHYVGE